MEISFLGQTFNIIKNVDVIYAIKEGNISRNLILEFANKVNIAPCIVAGRIKYDEKIYNNKVLNSFNIRMEF